MLNYLKKFFDFNEENINQENLSDNRKLQIAACALLLEIAKADDDFSNSEKNKIINIMNSHFNLRKNEVETLIEESEKTIDKSVSIYEITEILNKNLNFEEKYQIVKNLWELAYADGSLDKYEEFYIKKISNNFHFNQKDRISAKLEVKEKLKK